MDRIAVMVPGSTSNLGSGFDTLGLAVNLHLRLEAERSEETGVELVAGTANALSAKALVVEAVSSWVARVAGLRIRITSEIPIGRGLGASAALRVAAVKAASALAGEDLTAQNLLNKAYALEHHPDNSSPSIYGGFTVSGFVNGRVVCQRFEVNPRLAMVTLFPDFEMPTGEARKLLPPTYSRADTAHALNRSALITAAFARQDYEALRGLFDDRLHQPYREKLIPQLSRIIRAGEEAGAIGGFLSGAGSGVICLTLDRENEVAEGMRREMPGAVVKVLRPENNGLRVDGGA